MYHSVEPQVAVLETQSMHCIEWVSSCPWLVQIVHTLASSTAPGVLSAVSSA